MRLGIKYIGIYVYIQRQLIFKLNYKLRIKFTQKKKPYFSFKHYKIMFFVGLET